MPILPQEVSHAWNKRKGPVIFSTVDKQWNPQKHPGQGATALKVETVYKGAKKLL